MITIEISKDDASPALNRLRDSIEGPAIQESMGIAGVNLLQDHFKALADDRHHDSAPHNFYADAARFTSYSTASDSLLLSISKLGIAQRYFGGTIEAPPGHLMTIPARDEAYGRRAREFNNLELLFGKNGPYALAERKAINISYKRGKKSGDRDSKINVGEKVGGGIFFWLVKSVTQDPDPSVLPEMETIMTVVWKAAGDYIAAKTEGAENSVSSRA